MVAANFLWLHFRNNRSLIQSFLFSDQSSHFSCVFKKNGLFPMLFISQSDLFSFLLSEHVSRTEKQSNFEPFFLKYKLKQKCEFETHLSPLSCSAVFRPRSPSPAVLDFDKEGEVVGGDDSQLYKLNCFW